MKAEEDEIGYLFYLFGEEDLYLLENDPQVGMELVETQAEPTALPALVAVEMVLPEVSPPVTTSVEPLIAPVAETRATIPPDPVVTPLPPVEPPKKMNRTVLVVNEPRATLLNPYDTEFLTKVLQVLGLSLDEVELINFYHVTDRNYRPMIKEGTVSRFITFGVPYPDMNLPIQMLQYEPTRIGGILFLQTDSLEGIRTDVERKKWLWRALKIMFGV